jgi:predicted PurR-regulated permease PerM
MKSSPLRWDITRILFAVGAIGGLIAASFWILKPFLPSAIWAVMIVIATWPEMKMVQKRLWGRRGLAVAVMTGVMLSIVLVPVAIAVSTLVDRTDEIVAWTQSLTRVPLPSLPTWVGDVPLIGKRVVARWESAAAVRPEELAARVTPYMSDIVRWLIRQAGSLITLFVQLLLTLAIAAILYAKGEVTAAWVLAFARRLAGAEGERAARLSAQAIRAIALGIVVTALVQSAVGGIGLLVTGVPRVVLLTALMFLLGLAQVGAVPVMLCAVLWLYWHDQTLWAMVLLGWSVVTGSLDNFLRPILIKKGADLPLLLVFAGVLGGLLAFGVVGLFVGPVVLAVSYTLLMAWVDQGRAAAEE